MAGDWIKMRADLFTHPKVFKIAETLGIDELTAVGALFCFWAWADKHSVDGRVDGATPRLIDRASRMDGLSAALVSVDWLSVDNTGISIPSFSEHNGDSAKERSLKNQRQARWREKSKDANVDAKQSTQPPTEASTREDKRREEKKEQKQEKNSSPSGSRLAPDWSLPADWKAWAEQERPELDILEQAARFADHWHAKAGKDARKSDWLATWRNWIRGAFVTGKPRAGPNIPQEKSKGRQAIELLEGLKHGMDAQGNRYGSAKADMPRLG